MSPQTARQTETTVVDAPARGLSLRWSLALLGGLAALCAVLEGGARASIERISRVEGRIAREHAMALAPSRAGRPPVLFVGNSLLDAAVQFEALRAEMAPGYDLRRFVVEQTSYLDWYFGVRRLFADGARPRTVVVMFTLDQLLARADRGDYSAYRLLATADFAEYGQRMDLHPTVAAGRALANVSMFYGLRAEIRNVILGRTLPAVGPLTRFFQPAGGVRAADRPDWRAAAGQRLAELRRECEKGSARLVLLLPPNHPYGLLRELAAVAAEQGVEAVIPFGPGAFGERDYFDGFHLNEAGATRYTAGLRSELRKRLPAWTTAAR